MAQQQYTQIRLPEEEINLRKELEKYSKYWPWFLIGITIGLTAGLLYIKYTVPSYRTTASIIIKDEKSKGPPSELSTFVDIGFLSGMGTNSIENEIGILNSRRMMIEVVKALNLNVNYRDEASFPSREIYMNSPFLVNILKIDERALTEFTQKNPATYRLKRLKNKILLTNIESGEGYQTELGKSLNIGFADIVINENPDVKVTSETELQIGFNHIDAVASSYRGKVQVNLTDKNSSLIELTLEDPVKSKARDILDQLVLEYNREAIEDKNLIARNTAEFIDERLTIINEELDSVETGKEEFKEENRLTNIEAESTIFIENASEYNKRQQEVGTQLELSNAMIDYLVTGTNSDLLPANLGIQEEGVNEQIRTYNSLVLERNRILGGSTEKNPVVKRLNNQIDQMRGNVRQSLERMRSNLRIAQDDLNRQSAFIGNKISAVPSKERQYRGIERQQNIKEALYLFLLQKREENSLGLAVTAPKAKIVDSAYSSNAAVSTQPKIILLVALILGSLIPFLIINLKNLWNNKIQKRADLENASKEIPIVGEVPKLKKDEQEIILTKNERSILAEAFRTLHTNFQYLLVNNGNKKYGVKIFVTSTVNGEGKTFTAFNLAMTLAHTDKKVVIVGGDLRNPQLQRYEAQAKEVLGISDYLVNDDYDLSYFIKQSNLHKNLHFLCSGSIPPNSAELWRLDKTALLFKELESKYDYVIVDTAPSMMVADTFLINKHADLTLYLVRAGYTEKKLQEFALNSIREGKLHNVGFVLNNVEISNFGYGNKYGYTYGAEKTGFWSKLTKR